MKTILVIEDTHSMREEIIKILEFEGYQAIGAEDGIIGVQMAQKYRPDLILCDVMMPGLDGFETITAIRNDAGLTMPPFIFLTARATKADMRHGMELGADDYLTKPFTPLQLIVAVQVRLEKHARLIEQYQQKMDALRHSIALALPHELRTPLTQMLGFSELLMDSVHEMEPQDIQESARAINQSSQRMHHLVENFLTYTELESFYGDPERTRMLRQRLTNNSREVIARTAHRAAQHANRDADLKLMLFDCALHITIEHLIQIVNEVVDNALKFSPDSTPIHVSTTVEQGVFTMIVTNQGRGMTTEQIASIGAYIQFERERYEQQGMGLGLIIVKRLVELYNGRFWLTSIPQVETSTYIQLPI